MRDLQAALGRGGFRTQLVVESRNHTALSGAVTMPYFKAFQPDLVILIDHHRRETPDRFIDNVPFVCWIQDELLRLYSQEVASSSTTGFPQMGSIETPPWAIRVLRRSPA